MAGPNRNQSFDGYAVTKHDTTANVFDAFFVGVTGDVKVTTSTGAVLTLVGVPAYTVIPVRVTLIWSTGTTATNIVGCKYGIT
jgi:hypothetical protein